MPNEDVTSLKIRLTLRNLFIGGTVLFSVGMASAAAYLNLKSETKANNNEIRIIQCDIRELKNFMIYGLKPSSEKECK